MFLARYIEGIFNDLNKFVDDLDISVDDKECLRTFLRVLTYIQLFRSFAVFNDKDLFNEKFEKKG